MFYIIDLFLGFAVKRRKRLSGEMKVGLG